jgi:hypothetical protein
MSARPDREHLLLAPRKRSAGLPAALLEAREESKDAVLIGGDRGAIVARVGAHGEILLDGELREDAASLGDHHQAAARDAVHALACDVVAVEQHAPRGRGHEAGDRAQRRGLACAVGADEAHQLAVLDLQVDALDGADSTVGDLQSLETQEAHAAPCCLGLPR